MWVSIFIHVLGRLAPNQSSNLEASCCCQRLHLWHRLVCLQQSCSKYLARVARLMDVRQHVSLRCAFAFTVVHARLVRKLLLVRLAVKPWRGYQGLRLVLFYTTHESVHSLWLNVGLVRNVIVSSEVCGYFLQFRGPMLGCEVFMPGSALPLEYQWMYCAVSFVERRPC